MSKMGWLVRLAGKRQKRGFAMFFLANLLFGGLSVASSNVVALITKNVASSLFDGILIALGGLLALSLLVPAAQYFVNNIRARLEQRLYADYSLYTVKKLVGADYAARQDMKTGDMLNVLSWSLNSVSSSVSFLLSVFGSVILLVIILACLAFYSPALALAFAAPLPLVAGYQFLLTKTSMALAPYINAMSKIGPAVQDCLTNHTTVKAFRLAGFFRERFRVLYDDYFKKGLRGLMIVLLPASAAQIIDRLPFIVLCVVAGMFYIDGKIDMQTATVCILLAQILTQTLSDAVTSAINLPEKYAHIDKMIPIWSLPEEKSGAVTEKADGKTAVVFEDVSFAYGEKQVLRGVSFSVEKGRRVALVGPSGCGKSTVMKLITGLYQAEGNISVWGVPVREWNLPALRSSMSVVSQDTFVLSRTLRGNLTCVKQDASETEIGEALRGAELAEFVSSLPDGLDTLCAERGQNLSGGQRQRIALARAFLRDSGLILLDEATSALDVKTEKEIQKTIDGISRSRTVVTVAHRLSTIAGYDEILVMDGGRITERGTHAELLGQVGLYAGLYQSQLKEEAGNE